MKRFGSECAIKKQNGPNKEGTAPLVIHSKDQCRAECDQRVQKQVAPDPRLTQHTSMWKERRSTSHFHTTEV